MQYIIMLFSKHIISIHAETHMCLYIYAYAREIKTLFSQLEFPDFLPTENDKYVS